MFRSSSIVLWLVGFSVVMMGFWPGAVHAAPSAQEIYLPALTTSGPTVGGITVSPQRDPTRTAVAEMPLAGGELTATAVDGTRFTLSIPPNALLHTTTITLTPIVQVGGLPVGEFVGAVQIEAIDFELFEAALLEVIPAGVLPAADEFPFAYYDHGQDFHQYPILPYAEAITFPIDRLKGGYGIARVSNAAAGQGQAWVAQIPDLTPVGAEARLRSRIAALLQAERRNTAAGAEPNPALWAEMRELALDYYRQVIEPILQPSTVDCAFAEANIWRAVSWLRSIELLFGASDSLAADPEFADAAAAIVDALIKATENCYYEATLPCMDWENAMQVNEVLRHHRTLTLLGAEGNVTAPTDLDECVVVDVRLSAAGDFHYSFQPGAESGWHTAVRFRFVDDSVSGVGYYNPFLPLTSVSPGARARGVISVTAKIDNVWQPVARGQRFFCRDQIAERIQELMISFSQIEGEPELPPQLFADNIGCWRWTGTVRSRMDTYPSPGTPENYTHLDAEVTLERDPDALYFPFAPSGEIRVEPLGYRIINPGHVDYDERLYQINTSTGGVLCDRRLSLTITNPAAYARTDWPAMRLPNAGFGRDRQAVSSIGSELEVNAPYTVQGSCGPAVRDIISLWLTGPIELNGKRIYREDSGFLGEQSGTSYFKVDLRALRE